MTDNVEKSLEKHFADWESEVIGYGYGTGEPHTLTALKAFLEAVGRPDHGLEHGYDYEVLEKAVGPSTCWLLISILARRDLIEYGTSPRYGWLTKRGMALREFVKSKTADELIEIVCDWENIDHCTPTFCNCGPDGSSDHKLCKNPFWVNKGESRW